MCGIAGTVDFSGRKIEDSTVRRMCGELKHRGPDDEGIYNNALETDKKSSVSVIFGHRRLSIIDLEKGHQPIFNEDRTVCLVYNGMIYNYKELRNELVKLGHRFRTNSDTEVIVHLYEEKGERFAEFLRGMFGLAIWDSKEEKLILARDFIGKKPLFYTQLNNKVIFCSELRAMLEDKTIPREIDHVSIDNYLTHISIPAPRSIYKNIKKVKPAHMVIFDKKGKRESRYWQLDFQKKIVISEKDAVSEVLRILKESVKLRLVSDVPLGVLLSGGVDSSSIVAIARQVARGEIKTFSVGFEESAYNELPYARTIADKFNTKHHECVVKPNVKDILPKLVRHFGEPYGDSSAIPTYYLAEMAHRHVKVALNGDGGDETFIGYKHYFLNLIAERVYRLSKRLKVSASLNAVSGLADKFSYDSLANRITRFAGSASLPAGERYKRWVSVYGDDTKKGLYSEKFKEKLNKEKIPDLISDLFSENAHLDIIETALFADISVNLVNDLLVKMDISCMAHGLEARSPLLDRTLIEFVASLPVNVKMRNFQLKYLLKTAMKDIVPRENLHRTKKGFSVPLSSWLKGELNSMLHDVILEDGARIHEIFNKEYIKSIYNQHMSGKRPYPHHLWLLLMLELWFREFEHK